MKRFDYVGASSVKEAVSLLSKPGAKANAGGTDLMGLLREGLVVPSMVVNLKTIPNFSGIKNTSDGGVAIGPMTTLTEIAENADMKTKFPVLAQAAAATASPQIRNVGTISGNVCQQPRCWYFRNKLAKCYKKGGDRCFAVTGDSRYHAIFGQAMCFAVHPSDLAPSLVAMNAKVKISGSKGDKTVDMEKFFVTPREDVLHENILQPGDVVTEIQIPAIAADSRAFFVKERERGTWDFSTVGVAAVMSQKGGKVSDVRLVLSGVAPVPWRVRNVEAMLAGVEVGEKMASLDYNAIPKAKMELAREAAASALAGARPLSNNSYKIDLAKALIQRAILATT
jgi:xanthine dehydrogenase YagS FAD-binding subunit